MVRSLRLLMILAIAFCSIARAHADAALQTQIVDDFTTASLGEGARLSVVATELSSGRRLVEIAGDDNVAPASLLKLFTVAAAVDELGPDHRFVTTLEIEGTIDAKGALSGPVVIRGGGDPAFGPRFQRDRSDTNAVLRQWAADLRALGIRRVDGDIIGDDSMFTGPREALGWDAEDRGAWYAAPVSALTFNDACLDVAWDASGAIGAYAKGEFVPPTKTYELRSLVRIEPTGTLAPSVRMSRIDGQNRIFGRGSMPRGSSATSSGSVEDPARTTADLLREEMQHAGIVVTGIARSGARTPGVERRTVARHFSPPLSEFLRPTLAHSQNLYAECLLRHLALERGLEPSFDGGTDALESWMDANGVRRPGMLLVDGSGLSPMNRLAPRAVHDLLVRWGSGGTRQRLWRSALARPGQPGTLADRLPALVGRFEGKTGSLSATNALAGYVTRPNGTRVAMIAIVTDATAPADQVRAFLDSVAMRLAE